MAIDTGRRRLLQAGALALAAWPLYARAGEERFSVLAAYDVGRNQHRAGAAGGDAALTLPARGHHLALLPGQEAIVFARRPGYQIARFNWHSGATVAWYDYPDQRHGFGHGIVHGGRLLTTDSDIDSGNGLLTVRDLATLQPLAELPSGGIGPHELVGMDDGRVLVANGGILTLPESGRIKLNRHSMQPSLDVIDLAQGRSVAQYTLPDSRYSIRHLARLAADRYAVALQYEGDDDSVPVAALWQPDRGLRMLPQPDELLRRCDGYASSVAASANRIVATATRGDAVLCWDGAGNYLAAVPLAKPSGVAATRDGRHFIVSNELGDIVWLDSATLQLDASRSRRYPVKWDNHLSLAYG
ncbi:DUF1513 domain-containing protein [Vogesella facilis]|uniref:DUF1513 domain-containing protein n=1 Tax=Vogesella facilis TaxID=1655232 RepID=A0ABV7RFN5_9NEIS